MATTWPTWKENKGLTLALIVLFVFLTMFVWAKTAQTVRETKEIGRPQPFEHTITLDAEAKVIGAPNVATVSFGVETKAETAAEAQTQNTETMNDLLARVRALGIPDADIRTASYQSYEDVQWNPDRQTTETVGWVVSQRVTVTVRDADQVPTLLTTVGQHGATNISGPNFALEDQEELKAEARAEAIERAHEKAVDLAERLGVRYERVVGYSEYVQGSGYPMPYAERSLVLGGAMADAPDVAPGSVELTLVVNVTYKLKE